MIDFLKELTRRKVWLFGGIYLALGWVLLQVAIAIEATLSLPSWIDQIALVFLGLGFPVALLLAWAQESQGESKISAAKSPDPGDDKPTGRAPSFSVAILALNNLSDERELYWVADGLSEDITTRLGMVNYLMVAARNSSFAYKGEAPDIREVGKALNVRYVAEGSVRVIGENLRVTVQLIDTKTGAHIWSDSYDHPVAKLGGMQGLVVDVVSGEISTRILDVEIDRIAQLPHKDLSVQDLCALCWGKAIVSPSREGTLDAIDHMRIGLKRFPEAADLHAELAFYCCYMGLNYDRENRIALLEETEEHLREAKRLAPRAALVLWRYSTVRQMLGQSDEALIVGEQLAKLYPNYVMLPMLATTYQALGRYEEAVVKAVRWLEWAGTRHFDRQLVLGFKGNGCLGLGDFAEAEVALREAASVPPLVSIQHSLIVALAHQGKIEEARAVCDVYRTLPNALSLDATEKSLHRRSNDPAYIEMFLEGLKLAGLK